MIQRKVSFNDKMGLGSFDVFMHTQPFLKNDTSRLIESVVKLLKYGSRKSRGKS